MPPFHSNLESTGKSIGNIALMPLRQTSKGTARGPAPVSNQEDIVDQTINLFKVIAIDNWIISQDRGGLGGDSFFSSLSDDYKNSVQITIDIIKYYQ